jgi:hypothetical protein
LSHEETKEFLVYPLLLPHSQLPEGRENASDGGHWLFRRASPPVVIANILMDHLQSLNFPYH